MKTQVNCDTDILTFASSGNFSTHQVKRISPLNNLRINKKVETCLVSYRQLTMSMVPTSNSLTIFFFDEIYVRIQRSVNLKSKSWCPQFSQKTNVRIILCTVKSRFKKDLKLEIHLHKAFFSGNQFLDSLHKSFLNQTSLDLRKENELS